MRIYIALAVLFAAARADAAPRCVTIAHAPDDVRAVVEAWVRAEPNCRVNLEVRIVPTDGGFYLFARDDAGRVRERVVPDAQSAGVLVASWVADDTVSDPTPGPPPPPLADDALLAPGALAPAATPALATHWLSLGILDQLGFRGEVDLLAAGRWSVGLAAQFSRSFPIFADGVGESYMEAHYWKALAYVASTWRLGRWYARPSLGAGMVVATGHVWRSEVQPTTYDLSTGYGTAQGALMLGRLLFDNWSIHAGPIATLAMPRVGFERMDGMLTSNDIVMHDGELVFFAGVQRRLW